MVLIPITYWIVTQCSSGGLNWQYKKIMQYNVQNYLHSKDISHIDSSTDLNTGSPYLATTFETRNSVIK